MLGFEPQISGVGSNRSTNWATTTAQNAMCFYLAIKVQTRGCEQFKETRCENSISSLESLKKMVEKFKFYNRSPQYQPTIISFSLISSFDVNNWIIKNSGCGHFIQLASEMYYSSHRMALP